MRVLFGILFCFLLASCSKDDDLQSNEINNQEELSSVEIATRDVANDCCGHLQQELLLLQINCATLGGSYCDQVKEKEEEIKVCTETKIIDCPPGYFYDGENCSSRRYIPEGADFFVYKNLFYVEQDCNLFTTNDCCPPGYVFDGANCSSRTYIPEGYDWFVYNNTIYVEAKPEDCRDRIDGCCPDGYVYDGANCTNGVMVPEGYTGFAYATAFFTEPNCSISSTNNCCPDGYTFDGSNCWSGISFPDDHEEFVHNGRFYVTSGDDCP